MFYALVSIQVPLGAEAIQGPHMDSAPAYAGVRGAESAAKKKMSRKFSKCWIP